MKPIQILALTLALFILPTCRFKSAAPEPAEEHADAHAGETHGEDAHAGTPREGIAGVRTEPVGLRTMDGTLLASGTLAVDPKRVVQVSARTRGRTEEVLAFEGDRVEAEQPLLRLSSPAFLAAQAEVLQAAERMTGASEPRDRELAESLVDAAQLKLQLMGMTDREMDDLRHGGHLLPLLILRAPRTGTVIASAAVAGAACEEGAPLFTIADLSTLLAKADLYDEHIGLVRPGAGASVEVHAYPDRPFAGRLIAVGDVMDESSRTVQVRVEVANTGGLLKPGMFADVTFTLPGGPPVAAVPESALRSMDGRTVVFVLEDGRYGRREVRTGRKAGGWAEILDGVRPGERVVVEGSLEVKAEFMKGGLEGHGHD